MDCLYPRDLPQPARKKKDFASFEQRPHGLVEVVVACLHCVILSRLKPARSLFPGLTAPDTEIQVIGTD